MEEGDHGHRLLTKGITVLAKKKKKKKKKYKDKNCHCQKTSSRTLHFSTFQKPLNKYLYIPFESFHLASNKNKKTFIGDDFMIRLE